MGNVIMSGIVPPLEKPVGLPALSTVAEGSIVKLNENGSPVEFYVAKHDYESGLNGAGRTLLVRKDCYDERVWNSELVNAYATSDIDSWLNGTYKALLDADIQGAINTTKFYYTPGNDNNSVTTLTRAIFLLSVTELGQADSNANVEGSRLPIYSTIWVAYHNGSSVDQWTRTPSTDRAYYAYVLNRNGEVIKINCNFSYWSRPCFTLPATAMVLGDGTVKLSLSNPVELEYIQSDGTQYIDTGFVPNQDTRVVFSGEFPITSGAHWLFGARIANGNSMFGLLLYNSKYEVDYGTKGYIFTTTSTATVVDVNGNEFTLNGDETLVATEETFAPGYPMFLFTINSGGSASESAASAKLRSCKIYDNGALIRDFVPWRNSYGDVGVYDKVNNKFYGNSGDGSFTAGPEV